ncbi:MAG TPA: ABC transporter permease [Cyanobacteria bacterium UBA12227]|nr:ABC transporter permease [Cyanobacteria bacterium UBA12227]HAX88256.1 ABC transporter permease [Cyanobacteria bacterium UBA11370]
MGHKPDLKDQLLSKSVMRWAIALAVGATLATGVTAIYLLNQVKVQPTQATSSPSETPAIEAVTALGRIEPKEQRNVSAPMSMQGASKVDKLLVSKLDRVRANQVIAIMDNRDELEAAVRTAQKNVEVAKTELARVKAGAKAGEIQAQQAKINSLQEELKGEKDARQTTIDRLETQRNQTEQAQAQTIKAREAAVQAQNATIKRLEAERDNAQQDLESYLQLANEGVISKSELRSRQLRVQTEEERISEEQSNLSQAEANLSEAEANRIEKLATLSKEIEEARVNRNKTIAVLEAQIQEEKATLDQIKEIRPVDIQKAEAEIERAIAEVEKAQKDLESAYIKTPVAGQILDIYTEAGEAVDQENGIVLLGTTNEMKIVAQVYESDISKVRLGQQVAIQSEGKAFEGELRGTVSEIEQKIGKKDVLDTDPAADVDARVVEVDIRLNPNDSKRIENLTNSQVVVQIYL